MNRHEPVNLHDDARDLVPLVAKKMKMVAKKKDDQNLDDPNLVAKKKDDQMKRM
jgi:hypothetical protein